MNTGDDDGELLDRLCAYDRMQATLDAAVLDRTYALWRAQCRYVDDHPLDSVIEEMRLVRNIPRGRAIDTVETAIFLHEHMPGALTCMREGLWNLFHASKARKILEGLPEEALAAADSRITERLHDKGRPREWVRYVRRLADGLAPEAKAARIAAARASRYVSFQEDEDGTGSMFARLPTEDLAACQTRVDKIARSLRGRGDSRTLDQLRADVVTDLLTGREQHSGVRVLLNVHVPLGVALEMSDEYCRINGYGEIPAHTAQAMLADPRNAVRKVLTDPDTGVIRGLGRRRYRPSKRQREYVRLRDQRCRVPGCRRPIAEIDHVRSWAHNGTTDPHNLQGLCRLDHKLKSVPGWHHTLDHRTGELEVTTPSGHTYRSDIAD
ncbi:HNH endonuclease signature motif containing protein [Sciscionella sediminilitoris]|uniref:HNH endonuclease signature motif containing protein n=1 Tax=Sciscionella sediminilitoris TaxID=1445613 RepID=UPI001E6010DD|nr:HNH endonuclease signature motif containing protein [Sciscionella sp. SE31]